MTEVRKVVLAYSGGLDTSIILKWLQDRYGCEVVTFTADLGQGEELEPARRKAEALGAADIHVEDVREEFARDFVFPMFRANAVYEGEYLLGTSIARPLIAKHLVEIAARTGADAIAHGATGKGNDQVRFELGAYALDPDIRIIAPWREWDLNSRERLLTYAAEHGIPIERTSGNAAPYSMDANLLHISFEGNELEVPATEPDESMWRWTRSPEDAPDTPRYVELTYRHGDVVAIDGEALTPAAVIERLNAVGGEHGVGRIDIVENRYVGMKSRGCYETPGGTIMLRAHRAIESITLDREAAHTQGRADAALRPRHLQRLLVEPGAADAAGADRRVAAPRQRHGPAQALQGQRAGGGTELGHRRPVRPRDRDVRGRPGRIRPEGRGGLHPAQRAAAAHRGTARAGVRRIGRRLIGWGECRRPGPA